MPKLYWDSIEKGEQVAPVTKSAITRVQIAKFAAASQDWSPLHLDDDFAKGAGYGGVFAHGAIALAFATEAVGRWIENGRILGASAKFRKLVWPGDILRATGTVADRYEKNGEFRVDVDVWAENQNHDVVMQGQVTCLLWKNDKEEKKSKAPWPSASNTTIKERRTAKPIPRNEADANKAREALAAIEAQKKLQQQQQQGRAPAKAASKPTPPPPPVKPASEAAMSAAKPQAADAARAAKKPPAPAAPPKSAAKPAPPPKAAPKAAPKPPDKKPAPKKPAPPKKPPAQKAAPAKKPAAAKAKPAKKPAGKKKH